MSNVFCALAFSVPADFWPSPQSISSVKSPGEPNGLVSVSVPRVSASACPFLTRWKTRPAQKGALVTAAVPLAVPA